MLCSVAGTTTLDRECYKTCRHTEKKKSENVSLYTCYISSEVGNDMETSLVFVDKYVRHLKNTTAIDPLFFCGVFCIVRKHTKAFKPYSLVFSQVMLMILLIQLTISKGMQLPWPLRLLSMSFYLTLAIRALVNILLPYFDH